MASTWWNAGVHPYNGLLVFINIGVCISFLHSLYEDTQEFIRGVSKSSSDYEHPGTQKQPQF